MEREKLEGLAGGKAEWDGEVVRLRLAEGEIEGLVTRVEDESVLSFERALSHALLRGNDEQFVLLSAPSVSEEIEERLQAFVGDHAPGRGWGFLDDAGDGRLVLPNLEVDRRQRSVLAESNRGQLPRLGPAPTVSGTRNQSLFTDLNQWLLKVLILNEAPSDLWDRPRISIQGPSDLSGESWIDVSQGKAYQFAHTLREMGHLVWRRGTFRLVEVDRLLRAWLDVARSERPLRTPVRSIMGDAVRDVLGHLETIDAAYAHAGLLASESYGLRHVSAAAEEVYVFESIPRFAEAAMLDLCDENQAELYLLRPIHRAPVARGVQLRGGSPVVDLVQVALDAVRRPARGREQADLVVDRIASWFR